MIQLEDTSCPLGCKKNDEIILTGRDLIHDLPGEFTVVKCRTCNLMRTNPRPTADTIGYYYPDDYGPYLGTLVSKEKSKRNSGTKKFFTFLKNKIFDFNSKKLPPLNPGSLLEIGCASGSFLHQMATSGWKVQGIEFSEKAAQSAAQLGFQVHAGSLETAPKPAEPFDLIVGWMVLEHLHDPFGGLQKLSEWAKPGAWLVVSVPNAASLSFRLFKNKWHDLHLPNHLFHFTPDTCRIFLSASGWELKNIHYQRILGDIIASIGYFFIDIGHHNSGKILIKIHKKAKWLNYLLYPIAYIFSLFGLTGRMTIWARVNK